MIYNYKPTDVQDYLPFMQAYFFKVTQRRPVEILYVKDHLNEQQPSKPNSGKGFHDHQWKLPPTKPFSISVFSTLVKQY